MLSRAGWIELDEAPAEVTGGDGAGQPDHNGTNPGRPRQRRDRRFSQAANLARTSRTIKPPQPHNLPTCASDGWCLLMPVNIGRAHGVG
jgi:hypothetical protein